MEFGDTSLDGQPSPNFNPEDLEMEVNFVYTLFLCHRSPKTEPIMTYTFVQMYSETLAPNLFEDVHEASNWNIDSIPLALISDAGEEEHAIRRTVAVVVPRLDDVLVSYVVAA